MVSVKPPISSIAQAVEAYRIHGTYARAARETGIAENTLRRWVREYAPEMGIEGMEVPSEPIHPEDDIESVLAMRRKEFAALDAYHEAAALKTIKIKQDSPIGILHFGDPHLDDPGTDIIAVERHVELIRRTPGLYGANVGDTTNNWIGRLARLYAEQATSARQAWTLAQWFIESINWLYMIGGNHDLWSGQGDPLRWLSAQAGVAYRPSSVRLALQFQNGREARINARHDFAGNSQYNPAHGVMKAIQFGLRDHITIAGHKHTSGYGVIKDPTTGTVCHGIQVASYKKHDRYAIERGFRDQHISPCVVTIINPNASNEASFIQVFWDAEEAADYLLHLRRRANHERLS